MCNCSDEIEAGKNTLCHFNLQSLKCVCNQQSTLQFVISRVQRGTEKAAEPLTFAIIVSFKPSLCTKYPWNRNLEMAFTMENQIFFQIKEHQGKKWHTRSKDPRSQSANNSNASLLKCWQWLQSKDTKRYHAKSASLATYHLVQIYVFFLGLHCAENLAFP